MSTIDEIMGSISAAEATEAIDELLVIDPNTRQINIPSAELTFGVVSDTHSERKYFQCPRVVGDNLDLTSCFIRVNYRNANGEVDAYLVDDVRVVGENILFSWELHRKVTMYAGQVKFVVCACRPGGNGVSPVEWHTTQANGIVLAGIEPDGVVVENETADVISQLVALVESRTEAVENVGAEQVAAVQSTGETVSEAVVATAEAEKTAMVAEIDAKGANTLASIPDDYTALGAAVDTIERGMAPGIVCSVEGESAYVSDASDNYVQNLRVFGRSTQDGVPSPDAPVVIESVENPTVAVTGKNLLPYPYIFTSFSKDGVTVTANTDGTITINGTTSANVWVGITESVVLSVGTYTLSIFPDNWVAENGYVLWQGKNAHEGTIVATIPEATSEGVGVVLLKGVTYNNVVLRPQIEFGSVATNYEPYAGSTLPITHTLHGIPVSSGGNYTDSNGQQWICDEVDLARGVYVRRVKSVIYDGSEPCSLCSDGVFNRTCSDAAEIHEGNQISFVGIMCDSYEAKSWVDVSAYKRVGCALRWGTGVGIYDDRYTTTNDFNAHLAEKPVTIIYLLATPIETPLSETEIAAYRALRTNKPNTTILNDAGAWMSVEYVADTKLYIDNKIAALVSGG